jgi:ArsR family transcriptional regulator
MYRTYQKNRILILTFFVLAYMIYTSGILDLRRLPMETVYEHNARVFKAFCDETRLRILALLQSGEKCTCRLMEEMDMPQSTLSYHMKVLCESGVVAGRQEGKWTHYHICENGGQAALEILQGLIAPQSALQSDKLCCIK